MDGRCGSKINSVGWALALELLTTPAIIIKYGNYHGRLIGNAHNGLHSNVLLGQIMISNTRSKRVNENIATSCTHHQ